MRAPFAPILWLALALAASCATPPPQAYVGGAGRSHAAVALGGDASGEACNQLPGDSSDTAEVFCGTWQEPAAMVRGGPPGGADALMAIATGSPRRQSLDAYFTCHTSQPKD